MCVHYAVVASDSAIFVYLLVRYTYYPPFISSCILIYDAIIIQVCTMPIPMVLPAGMRSSEYADIIQ